MKYLKLINNEECLKLASCLDGSKDKDADTFIGVDEGWFISRDNKGRYFGFSFLNIPLETIKLNPFKCMEHGVKIVNDGLYGVISPADLFFDKLSVKTYLVSGCDLLLDLNSLPNGATITEEI